MVGYGRTPKWELLPNKVVSYASQSALIGPVATQYHHIDSSLITIGEEPYHSGRFAIVDVSNNEVGEFVVLEPISIQHSAEDQIMFQMDLIYMLIGGSMVALLIFALRLTQKIYTGKEGELAQAQKEWADAFDALQDPIFLHDKALKIIHVNRAYAAGAGMTPSEMIGQPYWEIFPKMDGPLEICQRVRSGVDEQAQTEVLQLESGQCYESRGYPIYDTASHYKYSIHILRDITDTKAAQEQLQQAAIAFDNTFEGIMVTDPHGTILTINHAFSKITGYQRDEAIGKNPRFIKSNQHDAHFYETMWSELREHGHWQGEIWNQRKDGEIYPEWLTITAVYSSQGEITHYIAIFSDLSELKSSQEKIQRLSHYDSLTDLPNRVLFIKLLSRQVQRADMDGRELAVITIDLNRFEHINETLGHSKGDQLLQLVAERLISIVHPGDPSVQTDDISETLEIDNIVSRVAGDQFAIVMANIDTTSSASNAAEITRRILDTLAESFQLDGQEIFLTASAGITLFPQDGVKADILLKQAHAAAHSAKKRGTSNYYFYSEELGNAAAERHTLASGLRRAVELDELTLHYQPQLSMDDGRIIGFEALIRWNHPEMGMVPPDKFISLAEESGLIVPIGEWVLRTACNQAKAWHDAGLNPGIMAINVSGVQIERYDLVAVIERMLHESGLQPQYLEIELTESSVMNSPKRAISQLERLKSLGVMLAIDDFGTGYSSLSHLLKFPFDKLKIDRGFVTNVTTKPHDAMLARSIIAMAQGMGLRVIAEGIETEEQLYYLKHNGCDELQGYYFSRPIDTESVEKMLNENQQIKFREESDEASQQTILIVDDEENILRSLKRLLRQDGYRILTAINGDSALQLMAKYNVQVILSDMRMPEISGTELLKKVSDLHPHTIRMILSGYADINAVTEAVNNGGLYKFLLKPWDDNGLREQIKDAFKVYKSNRLKHHQN